jgi:penicillin G amidase
MHTGEQFSVKYGAAMRNIVDMADPSHAWSMLPTGQSGHVGSTHYSDQSVPYVTGKYRPMLMDESEIKQNAAKQLMFISQTNP